MRAISDVQHSYQTKSYSHHPTLATEEEPFGQTTLSHSRNGRLISSFVQLDKSMEGEIYKFGIPKKVKGRLGPPACTPWVLLTDWSSWWICMGARCAHRAVSCDSRRNADIVTPGWFDPRFFE